MRSRRLVILVSAFVTVASAASAVSAQTTGDRMAGGFTQGDYLRVGGGLTSPINAQGSLKDWDPGPSLSLTWEGWSASPTGLGRAGFGIGVAYSLLPLNETEFRKNFTPLSGGSATTASGGRAGILEVTSNLRIRIPFPYVMPAVNLGFGLINWHPGKVNYATTTGVSGSARQVSRTGAELSFGGSLERNLWDRYGAYVEGSYVYGYTSFGQGYATPGTVCSTSCDPLKNTTVTTFRAGLRVKVGE